MKKTRIHSGSESFFCIKMKFSLGEEKKKRHLRAPKVLFLKALFASMVDAVGSLFNYVNYRQLIG